MRRLVDLFHLDGILPTAPRSGGPSLGQRRLNASRGLPQRDYTFRGRLAKGPRGYFTGFSPAISGAAKNAKGRQIRAWHLNRRSGTDLSGLAGEINPQVRGWINYYGAFYRSELRFLAWRINEHLARWAMHKFKRFRGKYAEAMTWLQKVYQYQPGLFAHWQLVAFTTGRTAGAG